MLIMNLRQIYKMKLDWVFENHHNFNIIHTVKSCMRLVCLYSYHLVLLMMLMNVSFLLILFYNLKDIPKARRKWHIFLD